MGFFESSGLAILEALIILWNKLIEFVPNLIAALIILGLGILLAKAIAKIVQKVVEAVKVDGYFRKINMVAKLEEGGTRIVLSEILGWLVQWFLYIALLVAVSEILHLGQFTNFLQDIALYLPNVIIAVLILIVGIVLGDFVEKLIINIMKSTKAKLAPLVGQVAKWSIFVFVVLAALIQLGVAVALIQTLFTAIVIMLALAAGLAFGLGGKDAAKEYIEKMKSNLSQ